MKKILYCRHGAWLTLGNVDLHLIKGQPAVHHDVNLIVSHIAIVIADMAKLKEKLAEMDIPFRKNISVPNPETGNSPVDQAFVRDPDGYYIEFCNCESLEKFVHSIPEAEKVR